VTEVGMSDSCELSQISCQRLRWESVISMVTSIHMHDATPVAIDVQCKLLDSRLHLDKDSSLDQTPIVAVAGSTNVRQFATSTEFMKRRTRYLGF
jgi:hypothetical protein